VPRGFVVGGAQVAISVVGFSSWLSSLLPRRWLLSPAALWANPGQFQIEFPMVVVSGSVIPRWL